jgi:hypothetical protein
MTSVFGLSELGLAYILATLATFSQQRRDDTISFFVLLKPDFAICTPPFLFILLMRSFTRFGYDFKVFNEEDRS